MLFEIKRSFSKSRKTLFQNHLLFEKFLKEQEEKELLKNGESKN